MLYGGDTPLRRNSPSDLVFLGAEFSLVPIGGKQLTVTATQFRRFDGGSVTLPGSKRPSAEKKLRHFPFGSGNKTENSELCFCSLSRP